MIDNNTQELLKKLYFNDDNQTFNNTEQNHTRQKRQSPGREALCEVNSQFIMPRAALNSRGNFPTNI